MDYIMFPIGLSYVASAIQRAGHELELIDLDAHRRSNDELRELLKEKDFDVLEEYGLLTEDDKSRIMKLETISEGWMKGNE